MKKVIAVVAIMAVFGFAIGALAPESAKAGTLVYESFDTLEGAPTDPLNGTTTDVGGLTWAAHTDWDADGTLDMNGHKGAFVPFVPAEGTIYTLSATLDPENTTTSNWYALGFVNNIADLTKTFDSTGQGIGWILNRDNGRFQNFLGPVTAGGGGQDPVAPVGDPIDVNIVLDTTDANHANWTVTWLANDILLRGPEAFGYSPNINYAGFAGTIPGSVDDFKLSVVPEPAGLGLIGLTLLAVRKRRS